MATHVLLSVDTELTWRHHQAGLSWQDNLARSYHAAGVGIPYQLETLAAHGLKACFFVDPMPALLFGIAPIRAMVAPIIAAGQEVQLHAHAFWADLAAGISPPRFELIDHDADEQKHLLATARNLLIEAGAPPPTAFRAGSYAANAATLDALAALGIRYDSSHNGSHHPWPSALPLPRAQLAPTRCRGVIELPVGQIAEQGGGLRHLQLCALSSRELEAALGHAARAGHAVTTIVSHSFELATRDGLRANAVIKRRFDRLCGFLAARRAVMPTVWCNDLDGLDTGADAAPLGARPWLSKARKAEQLWADARYERPATALTALSGSSASGLELLVPLVGL